MPAGDSISILDGSIFVVSDTHGDVEAGRVDVLAEVAAARA
jgi:hypothetical protein